MGATRTIKISALNIALHKPHSPDRYIRLMTDAYKLRHVVRLGALHGAMLGSLYYEDRDDPLKGINGEIYRFVRLDPAEPWFNSETHQAATDTEVDAISIPRHLLPHMQRIPFVLKPEAHEIWFVSRDRKESLGPSVAVKFFASLFLRLMKEQPRLQVEVTAIPDSLALEKMWAIPTLNKIVIELKRPNADDGESDEVRLLKRLEKQKAKRMTTELVAVLNQSIVPDAETRTLARVASRNGSVSVVGRDAQGMQVKESTDMRPLVHSATVDQEIETTMDVLRRNAGL